MATQLLWARVAALGSPVNTHSEQLLRAGLYKRVNWPLAYCYAPVRKRTRWQVAGRNCRDQ